LVATWAHLYTGAIDEKHILFLMNNYPNMVIDPPEPYIEMRFWGTGQPSGWQPLYGSYDPRDPTTEYIGYNSPLNGVMNCIEGLGSGPGPVYSDDDTNLGFLSPVKPGHHAWLLVPYASEPFFFFTEPPVDVPSSETSIFLPLTLLVAKVGTFLPGLQVYITSLFELDGEQFWLDGSPFELQ
jgi:hypothetical protein